MPSPAVFYPGEFSSPQVAIDTDAFFGQFVLPPEPARLEHLFQSVFSADQRGPVPDSDVFSDTCGLPPDIAHDEHKWPTGFAPDASIDVAEQVPFSSTFDLPPAIADISAIARTSTSDLFTSAVVVDSQEFFNTFELPARLSLEQGISCLTPSFDVFQAQPDRFVRVVFGPSYIVNVDFKPSYRVDVNLIPPT